MKAIINIYVKQIPISKMIFLIFACLLFSIGERQAVSESSYEMFILNMLTEHYYLTYMMVPMFLLFFYQSLENSSEFILIRTGYFWKSFLARLIAVLIQMICFVGIQVILFLIVGIGLKHSNQFFAGNELAALFSQYFSSPVLAAVTVTLFMIAGLFTVSVAILVFHHFFKEKITLVFIIILYILMTFGIKIPGISQFPLVFIDSYIIFQHNFTYAGKLIVAITSMLIINCLALILVKYYWRKQPRIQWKWRLRGIGNYYFKQIFTKKNILICIGIILMISLYHATNTAMLTEATFSDYISKLFYGHGTSEFHLLSFIEMLIMNSVPLYLFAAFLEEEKRDRNFAATIRLKYKLYWLNAIIRTGMAWIGFYVFSLSMLGSILGMAFDFGGQAVTLVLEITLLKFLDIFLQFLFMFLLYTMSRNITLSFLGLMAGNALSIWFKYVPMGISSIARSAEIGDHAFMVRMFILLILQLLIWIYIRTAGYQKIFK